MSELKVNKVSPRSGTTVTLGDSGDTITIPSGATLTNNGTATGFGIAWQAVKTSGFTAVAGEGYFCNTTSAAFTVTLPSTPTIGQQIQLLDYAGTFDTNALVISPNGNKIEGGTNNLQLTGEREGVTLTFTDATQGWLATSGINEGTDALEQIPYSIDFLVVAGGGGGGGHYGGGGGGAGGFRTSTESLTPGTVITITVGDGGTGGGGGGATLSTAGSASSISGSGLTTISSAGGGGAGNGGNAPGQAGRDGDNGGSGGGGGGDSSPGVGGTGNTPSTSPSQGNNGEVGSSFGQGYRGGGGGGASASGVSGVTSGNGGNGTASSITGSSVTYAGGGGGGIGSSGTPGTGGTGGGGNGVLSGTGNAGTTNLGGGGGGSGGNANVGGAGGKGVVILSMPSANFSGTTTGSPTESTSGGNKILVFNGSGSYTT